MNAGVATCQKENNNKQKQKLQGTERRARLKAHAAMVAVRRTNTIYTKSFHLILNVTKRHAAACTRVAEAAAAGKLYPGNVAANHKAACVIDVSNTRHAKYARMTRTPCRIPEALPEPHPLHPQPSRARAWCPAWPTTEFAAALINRVTIV